MRRSTHHRSRFQTPRLTRPALEALEGRTLPSTFTVMNLADSGPGSLRAAVTAAHALPPAAAPGPTIASATALHGPIVLPSGERDITASTTINGPGANKLAVSGNNASRVFDMTTGLNVTIDNLTITHGFAVDQAGGI